MIDRSSSISLNGDKHALAAFGISGSRLGSGFCSTGLLALVAF
jgi:hypothetical protein